MSRNITIFEQLRTDIIAGDYPPGTCLPTERDLAVHYAATRNTIREVVRRLQQAGLVVARQGSGTMVQDFRTTGGIELLVPFLTVGASPDERAQVLADLRRHFCATLGLASALSAERAWLEDVQRLRLVPDAAAFKGDVEGLATAHDTWTRHLFASSRSLAVQLAGNPVLDAVLQLRSAELLAVGPELSEWESAIVECVSRRDPAAATEVAAQIPIWQS